MNLEQYLSSLHTSHSLVSTKPYYKASDFLREYLDLAYASKDNYSNQLVTLSFE